MEDPYFHFKTYVSETEVVFWGLKGQILLWILYFSTQKPPYIQRYFDLKWICMCLLICRKNNVRSISSIKLLIKGRPAVFVQQSHCQPVKYLKRNKLRKSIIWLFDCFNGLKRHFLKVQFLYSVCLTITFFFISLTYLII